MEIQPVWNGAPLRLDSLGYALLDGETVSVTRLSMLLSDFRLERVDGGWAEIREQFAWIDAGARSTAAVLTGVPAGEYRSLQFAVGLDPQTNAADPSRWAAEHPLNPSRNGLHWSWQGGYIFLALEGFYRRGAETPAGYSYHFARDPNRTVVTLPMSLKLNGSEAETVALSLDVAALFNLPRAIAPDRDGNSTHSRDGDPIAAALRANLPGAFQVKQTSARTAMPVAPVSPLYLPAKFTPYPLRLSGKFPIPALPRDNPLLSERVELGRRLFHEPLLSRNATISCATCHDAEHAFADPRRASLGVDGEPGARHAMPLFNLAWKSAFFWDGRAPSLRIQALMPIQDQAEMDEQLEVVCAKLVAAGYGAQFAEAFGSRRMTPERLGLALESFLLTLVSFDSKFDRAMRGEGELSQRERRGFELFFTEYEPRMGQYGADCFHCHGGALFTDHQFHNNGLAGTKDIGHAAVTGRDADRAKFSTPSLRNVAITAPYMHDGRFATLEEVLDHYDHGLKRSATLDPNLAKHPPEGLQLSREDREAIVAFLQTLTDPQFAPTKSSGR